MSLSVFFLKGVPQAPGNDPNPRKAGESPKGRPPAVKGNFGVSRSTKMPSCPSTHLRLPWPIAEDHGPVCEPRNTTGLWISWYLSTKVEYGRRPIFSEEAMHKPKLKYTAHAKNWALPVFPSKGGSLVKACCRCTEAKWLVSLSHPPRKLGSPVRMLGGLDRLSETTNRSGYQETQPGSGSFGTCTAPHQGRVWNKGFLLWEPSMGRSSNAQRTKIP